MILQVLIQSTFMKDKKTIIYGLMLLIVLCFFMWLSNRDYKLVYKGNGVYERIK